MALAAITLGMGSSYAQILKNQNIGALGSSVSIEPGLTYRSVVGQPSSINLMVVDKTPIAQGFIHPQSSVRTKEKSIRKVNMKIYPNPSREAFQIDADLKPGDRIEVRNILGMLVFSESIQSSVQTKSIDIGVCAEGLYTLSVFGATEHLQTKLIEIIK
jgi:hypothetical protein